MEQQKEEAVVNSEMYRSRGFDDSAQGVELMSVDQCESMREMDDSHLVGAPVNLAVDAKVLARQEVPVQMVLALEAVRSAAARNSEESMRKPRWVRPPRSQRRSTQAQPPPRRRRDEEDVCFICFDGGSLVLCDRRGCPKAYHPACIKRDESFFRSKAKWNCGWHICNSCQKASHYMCYTCTFSLCKVCTKDADYFCVRGNKGFCGTCMRTVMLIENIPIGIREAVQVDFDDKGSWEYLFKVYWIYLKQKLSLTSEELTKAKNSWKAVVALPPKVESRGGFCNNNDKRVCSLENSCRNLEANNSKRRNRKDLSTATELLIHDFETERLWHYQDPAGNIQGPFSMLQLHKWSTTGHFPSDLRVWRINEKQEGSILLSDALDGQHSKTSVLICNNPLLPVDVRVPSDGAHKIVDAQRIESSDASWVDDKIFEVTWNSMQNDTSIHNNSDNESVRSNKWGSHSSSWTRHAHPVICNQQTEGSLKGSDLSKDIESRADQPQSRTTPPEEVRLTPSLQVREGCEDEKWNASQSDETINPPKTTGNQSSVADGNWKQEQGESYSGQASSGQGLGPPPINSSLNGRVSDSGMVSLTMSIERPQQKQEIYFPDLPSPTPKRSEGGLEGGELQLPKVPGDGFGSSQTKSYIDEWGSNLVSSSSLRPVEVASDYAATPTSGSSQSTHSSAVHLADGSSWQAFVPEPTEFCSLPDESVSDLLAEVEAMEALGCLGSLLQV
ncbi:hypothetical protein HS088_TW14G00107 [Tripterygium wilfordii]|uniref:Zinc finger CCCH domain-containing protein 44 n=1 Tax=Tripterygium wilfordii TaxID=458696 RepID=A0A7J7CPH0_TRIWF|nr:hypothetical protein HS088_TW14G00107 [Tripterygium wilfordii]